MSLQKEAKVGLSLFVTRHSGRSGLQILLGCRRGSHGAGEWAAIGGHMDFGELPLGGVIRGGKEEVRKLCVYGTDREEPDSFIITVPNFLRVDTLNRYLPKKQYVDLAFVAKWRRGEAVALEKDKCEGWRWFYVDRLPQPLFEGVLSAMDALVYGRAYYENGRPYPIYEI